MTTVNIFEQAARKKTRIQTPVGSINVEQLWDLPLDGNSKGLDLDTTAQGLHQEIESLGVRSFVKKTANPRKADLELQFALVTHVIGVKMEEDTARKSAAAKARELTTLTEALGRRQEQELANLSSEELQKRIDALKAA